MSKPIDLRTYDILPNERLIAYHEAGHGLIAAWQADKYGFTGYPTIWLWDLEQFDPYTSYRMMLDLSESDEEYVQVIRARIGYGGLIAQRLTFGAGAVGFGTTEDLRSISSRFDYVVPEVEDYLKKNRMTLAAIANALIKKKYLTGLDVKEIYERFRTNTKDV